MDLQKTNFADAAEAGYEFNLKLPTGETTDVFITVRGEQSKTVKQYARRKFNEYTSKVQQLKRKGKDADELMYDLDQAEESNVESGVIRTISWRGLQKGGVDLVFTPETATAVYKEHPWILEQVLEESKSVFNFRPK